MSDRLLDQYFRSCNDGLDRTEDSADDSLARRPSHYRFRLHLKLRAGKEDNEEGTFERYRWDFGGQQQSPCGVLAQNQQIERALKIFPCHAAIPIHLWIRANVLLDT
jgi:hypothetical protein